MEPEVLPQALEESDKGNVIEEVPAHEEYDVESEASKSKIMLQNKLEDEKLAAEKEAQDKEVKKKQKQKENEGVKEKVKKVGEKKVLETEKVAETNP